jgi:uncharacterized protein YecT (DUF1311 family)
MPDRSLAVLRPLLLSALTLCLPATYAANAANVDAVCREPATNQAEMAACAYDDFLSANARQAQTQLEYVQRLANADARRWRAAQRAWITWRTAQCDFLSAHSGSAREMLRWQCASRLTRARSADIERLAQCPEGDLACPPRRP